MTHNRYSDQSINIVFWFNLSNHFEFFQMEMCEEVFEKLCYIEYKKKAEDETVEVCNDFLSRDCEEEGKEIHKFGKNFVKSTQLGLNLKKKNSFVRIQYTFDGNKDFIF